MKLGDHPDLYAAIQEAVTGLDWAFGVSVWASDSPPGYRVTVSTGDRFLIHSRTVIIPLITKQARHIDLAVKAQIDEMKRELEGHVK